MAKTQTSELESFAKHIEEMVKKGKDRTTMARLICRLMTGDDVKVAAMLASKWVEWRYGKATERHEVSGTLQVSWYDQLLELRRKQGTLDQRKG